MMNWRHNHAGLVLAGAHLVLVGVTAVVVGSGRASPMAWLLFVYVDFPFSLLWVIGSSLVPAADLSAGYPANDLHNLWIPVVFLVLFGTTWWFLMPMWLQSWRRRRSRSSNETPKAGS
jgi:hypothetical protein